MFAKMSKCRNLKFYSGLCFSVWHLLLTFSQNSATLFSFFNLFFLKKLNAELSSLAQGGDRHRRDGARPAAGEAREGERRGGRRRRRRGDGGQNGGLENGPERKTGGGKKHKKCHWINLDWPGHSRSVQQMLTFTVQTLTGVNSSLANVPVCFRRRLKSPKMCLLIHAGRKFSYKLKHRYSFYF